MPRFHDFLDDITQGSSDSPTRIVGLHLSEVAVIADMIADPILLDVGVLLWLARELLNHGEGFENRAGIRFAAANVINLSAAGRVAKSLL